MKEFKNTDDELQRLIFEKGESSFDSEDGELYEKIHHAIKDEPEFPLGNNFAAMVTKEAVKRKAFYSALRSMIFKAVVSFIIVLIGASAFYFLAKDIFGELASLIFAYKYQLLFVTLLIVGIQFVDRLVLQKQNRNRPSESF